MGIARFVAKVHLRRPQCSRCTHGNATALGRSNRHQHYQYLIGTGQQRIRGDIDAAANTIFWGVPNATSVLLGGEWRGALVAPKASVVGDMRDLAMLSGNFFVNRFTLHQGRWLYAVPFLGPWVPTCDANRTNCH